ncbi:SDR family NAD(P)-dependent oxidoreductase [Rothia uropygialis]|uniref:SDR family NAD(P)-dependent oxidoreductase n=1 Tax=Kocuria sp. 36 TaxID=1415402 RepID=UPI00101D3490|nr:SDR family NAD(P)-dependent oxidoreductase [Kocuria sp. 36]
MQDASRKTIVITGASDGIGASAARRLSRGGHEVIVVGRSGEKTRAVAEEIEARYFLADFSDLSQVHSLASDIAESTDRIDVLANNAGGIFGKGRWVTTDGHEMTFQVNYLAQFYLTQLLMGRLLASKATVVNTSSFAHRIMARFSLEDLDSEKRYDPRIAYGNAKLADLLHAQELSRRYNHLGLASASFHPGVISSNFSRDSSGAGVGVLYQGPVQKLLAGPEQGSDTLVWLAEAVPGEDFGSGGYFAKRKPATMAHNAQNPLMGHKLWEASERMISDLPGLEP